MGKSRPPSPGVLGEGLSGTRGGSFTLDGLLGELATTWSLRFLKWGLYLKTGHLVAEVPDGGSGPGLEPWLCPVLMCGLEWETTEPQSS